MSISWVLPLAFNNGSCQLQNIAYLGLAGGIPPRRVGFNDHIGAHTQETVPSPVVILHVPYISKILGDLAGYGHLLDPRKG